MVYFILLKKNQTRKVCYHCGHVYDSASVKVTHRYVDCSEWECPGCKRIVDDRMWKGPADIIKLD